MFYAIPSRLSHFFSMVQDYGCIPSSQGPYLQMELRDEYLKLSALAEDE